MTKGGKRMVMWSLDSKRHRSLHTGQFRARGAVNPDSTSGETAPALPERATHRRTRSIHR